MKTYLLKLSILIALLMIFSTAFSQFTPYGLGLVQQPNSASARNYLQIVTGGGTNSGTVTNFSSGNLPPLFTTSVATPNTFPKLTFAQVSQNQNLVFASPDGAPGVPTFRSLVASDIPSLPYVSSVALALPASVFSISGSPVTGVGTLTGSFQNQNANTVFAGPAAGGAATPTFRVLLPADLGPFTNHSDVVPTTLNPGDTMSWSGSAWTNGPPSTNGTTIGTSLPGLLVRPVIASVSGVLSAPQWPDDTTYYFDEEFDSWFGNTSGQFGKNRWAATVLGGGGAVNNVSSNFPPYFGIIEIQSPTTSGNVSEITSFGSTGLLPYGQLRTTPNWLFHAIFFLNVTNQGSVYKIGLIDSSYQAQAQANSPSNCIWIRWDKRTSDGEFFCFEARRNGVIETNGSSIRVASGTPFKVTMYSTNSGTVKCQVNNETPVTMTNISDVAMTLTAQCDSTNGLAANRLWIDRISFMASSLSR